jgi:hypothetical protein
MFGKRGLSDIVVTVLIVLLVLAAVAIVWGFVRPMFEKSGATIQGQDTCIVSESLPVKCEYQFDGTDYDLTNVLIKHSKGGGVKEVKAILTLEGGASVVASAPSPGLLSSYDFKIELNTLNSENKKPISLEAGTAVDKGNGESYICPQVSNKIDCVEVSNGGNEGEVCSGGSVLSFCEGLSSPAYSSGCEDAGCLNIQRWCGGADFDRDGDIDISDRAEFNAQQTQCNGAAGCCVFSSWCNGADFNMDGNLDASDIAEFNAQITFYSNGGVNCGAPEHIRIYCYWNNVADSCESETGQPSCEALPGCSWG